MTWEPHGGAAWVHADGRGNLGALPHHLRVLPEHLEGLPEAVVVPRRLRCAKKLDAFDVDGTQIVRRLPGEPIAHARLD